MRDGLKVPVSVNTSMLQLASREAAAHMLGPIMERGIPPPNLMMELGESVAIDSQGNRCSLPLRFAVSVPCISFVPVRGFFATLWPRCPSLPDPGVYFLEAVRLPPADTLAHQ